VTALSYCGQTVRTHDPDRFLLGLFAEADRREALWALYAFNHEIAKTREVVTETRLGLIRLQWWKDAVAGIFNGQTPLKHQVVEPLAEAIAKYSLPREHFETLMYAREFDLEDRLPADLAGMASYAEFTSLPLLKLVLAVTGEGDKGAKETATGYALAGLLRAVSAHAARRRCYLPEALLRQEGMDQYKLYDHKEVDKIKPAVKAAAILAQEMLEKPAAKGQSALMRHMAQMYLKRLDVADYNAFILTPPPFMALRLWWNY
jgi:NADH dehydrogenase [ubiquinone] 1 alpha subcomplex assembly factor 6